MLLSVPASARMIQIRNVPARVHRELVRRAERRGLTLTQYVESVLEREVERPLPEDVYARIASRTRVPLRAAEAVLAARAERDLELRPVSGEREAEERDGGRR